MPRDVSRVGYRAVLRSSGAPRAFAFAMLGRLSYGTVSLSLLFTVQRATGSFTVAGGVIAAFGVTNLTMPVKSRFIDRAGQPRTLTLLGASYTMVLAGFCVLALLGVDRAVVYLVLGCAAGATAPPLGPSMRALWAALIPAPALRQRAYSLDSVVEESLYTLGPVLVGALIALGGPVLALTVSAALVLAGSLGLATSPAARRHAAPATTRTSGPVLGPLRRPGFVPVLVAILAIGLCLGAVDVTVAARAQYEGTASAAGYLLAALSLGSAIGGLAWGHRTHRRRRSTQLATLLIVLATGVAIAAWAPNLTVLGIVLAVTGLALAPAYVIAYLTADDLAPATVRTEATTWVNTANNLGAAVGAAAAGAVIDHLAASTPLIAAAVVLATAAPVVITSRRRGDRHSWPDVEVA